jgi:hypothetical protein
VMQATTRDGRPSGAVMVGGVNRGNFRRGGGNP